MSFWRHAPPPPRRAGGGIAIKNRRGAIGETWWSQRFVAALEAISDPARLARGRTYARAGQVTALVVAPGLVTAKVQGSRATPYNVTITLAALSLPQWRVVEAALAAQALYAAALLGGEMPPEIEAVFTEAGTPLFPTKRSDLVTACSCPDWANPCKHVAATYYVLAERFDADPFEIFRWRGRDRDDLVAALRALRGSDVAPEVAAPLPIAGFWVAGPEPTEPSGEAADVLAALGPLVVGGSDLRHALAPAYAAFTRFARARLDGRG